MPHEYLIYSMKEGEKIYNAVVEYANKHGQEAIGRDLKMSDLNVPREYKIKYDMITIKLTGNWVSKFKPEDDQFWHKNKVLRNPVTVVGAKYAAAYKDVARSRYKKKFKDKEWKDFNPVIHAATSSKINFVKEWIKFKQNFLNETYYISTSTHPGTFGSLAGGLGMRILRATSLVTVPWLSIPLNLLITATGMKLNYNLFNDPMELEAFAATYLMSKKQAGQFNKPFFTEKFKTSQPVSKEEFVGASFSILNINVFWMTKENQEKFWDIVYTEYMKIMLTRGK